jgi:hypothetical protein
MVCNIKHGKAWRQPGTPSKRKSMAKGGQRLGAMPVRNML